MPKNPRLLILGAAILAALASLSTIGLLLSVRLDSFWPFFACVLSTAASTAIFAAAIFSPRIQVEGSIPSGQVTPAPPPFSIAPLDSRTPEDPLYNGPLMHLMEECVLLFDELDRLRPSLDGSTQGFADHVSCRMQEILERSGVTIIDGDSKFDHRRHQHESSDEPIPDGAPIVETQSPGFAVGRRVFRRARVILA